MQKKITPALICKAIYMKITRRRRHLKTQKRGDGKINLLKTSPGSSSLIKKASRVQKGIAVKLFRGIRLNGRKVIAAVAILSVLIAVPLLAAGGESADGKIIAQAISQSDNTPIVVPTIAPTPTETLDPIDDIFANAEADNNNDDEDGISTEEEQKLAPGMKSDDIARLQQRLMDLDYMEPDEPTGYYGYQTKYALELFQRQHNLQVDGIAGEETLKLLYSDQAQSYAVSLEASGTDVEAIQEQLKELGYFKGKISGYFGEETKAAVIAFQKRNSLTPDGCVGSNTREALYSEDAIPAPKITPKPTPKPTVTPKPGSTSGSKVTKLLTFANKLLGKKYVRGGKGPSVFDCSGFVYYCLKNSGVNLKYLTSAGWAKSSYTKITSMSSLKKGDVVVFKGHVGLYIGGGKMINASSSHGKVIITTIFGSSYWNRVFICGRRVI